MDQPAGTGFSYVSNPLGYETNERTIGTELWQMIQEFYLKYPKYAHLDLYIVGESYGEEVLVDDTQCGWDSSCGCETGHSLVQPCTQEWVARLVGVHLSILSSTAAGHYVPATAQVIVESNSVYSKNLKGIGIGNGWVDPKLQYAAYSQVACKVLKF